jgi:hypothetical protein
MSDFKIIENKESLKKYWNDENNWNKPTSFKSKGRIVDHHGKTVTAGYKGNQYQLIRKRERSFTTAERIGRGVLGTLLAICTFTAGLFFSKYVKNLFKSKVSIHFAIQYPIASCHELPVVGKIEPLAIGLPSFSTAAALPVSPRVKPLSEHKLDEINPIDENPNRQRIELASEAVQSIDAQAPAYPLNLIDFKKLPQVSTRLLFQLEADEFGLNSELEGCAKNIPLAYVLEYIKARDSQGDILCDQQEELIRELSIAYDIAESPNSQQTLHQAIQNAFATGSTTLIPGGWVGKPSGHAMMYELIPESGETATLRIFNTGEGIQEHDRFQVGVKDKVGYVEWKGISRDKLLDPHFSQAIDEMNTFTSLPEDENKSTDYSSRDIYSGLRNFLEVKEVSEVNVDIAQDAPLKNPQKAGTCSYRALLAFIKTKMSPTEYRHFTCDMRLQALASHVLSEVDPDEKPADEISEKGRWRLIKKSLQAISRKVDRLYTNHIIGPSYLEKAQSTLKLIAEWVEFNHDQSLENEIEFSRPIFKSPQNQIDLPSEVQGISSSREEKTVLHASSVDAACSHLMENLKEQTLANPNTVVHELKKIRLLLEQAHKQRDYSGVKFATVDIAKRLSVEEDFWKQIPGTQKELEATIGELNAVADFFFTSCYHTSQPDSIFPEQIYAIMKILHVQNLIATRSFPKVDLCVPFNCEPLFFQPQDELIERELNHILKKVENVTLNDEQLFKFVSSSSPYDKSEIYEHRFQSGEQLSDFIQQQYPEVLKKIAKDNPAYLNCSKHEKGLLLYTSPHLPSWLKNLRDTRQRLTHLIKAHIVPPTHENASLQFNMRIDKQNCKDGAVYIDVEGIDFNSLKILPYEKRLSERSFAATQRGIFKAPMQQLSRFLAKMDSSRDVSEEELIAEKMKNIIPEFSEEKSKELIHPFLTNRFRLVEIVEYFSRYPDRLRDPDFQQILQMALFGFFNTPLCDQSKEAAPIVMNFLTKQLKHYAAQNDLSTSVFLIRMNRHLSHYENFKDFCVNGTALLKGFLQNQGLLPEEKSLLYAELVGHLGEKTILSKEEIADLLLGSVWMKDTPLPEKWDEPKYAWEYDKALQTHSKAIEDFLAPEGVPNQPALKGIYNLSKEKASLTEWVSAYKPGELLRFVTAEGDVYDPLQGRLFAVHQETYLPSEIRNTANFRLLFPLQNKARALPEDVYTFQDAFGNSLFVKKGQSTIMIEQERNGKKYSFVPSDVLTQDIKSGALTCLESRYLIDKFSCWRSIENPKELLLISHETHQAEYTVQLAKKSICQYVQALCVDRIKRIKDNAFLSAPSKLFKSFEVPSYIQEWYDANENIIEIELPRFSLSFKPRPEDNTRLECMQYPGWILADNQAVKGLGGCCYHLLLIGPDGKRKVLLPNQELESPQKKEVLEPRFNRKQELEFGKEASFDHYSYEVDAKGELKGNSKESWLHLAATLAAHQEYERAANCLRRQGEKLSSYSAQEIVHLERIMKIGKVTGDESGEQNALGLYAAYLLATNSIQSPAGKKNLPLFYRNYLLHFRNITALRLSEEEELRLVKNILAEKFDPHFFVRLRELDPDYASTFQQIEQPSAEHKPSLINVKEVLENIELPYSKGKTNATPPILLTRAGSKVKEHIFDLSRQAIQGTPEQKKWLRDASLFLLSHSSAETRSLGVLFREIMDNPERFSLPPSSQQTEQELKKWWRRTIERLPQTTLEGNPSRNEPLPITPRNFRLESARSSLASIPFSFEVENIPPLDKVIDPSINLQIQAAILVNEARKQNPPLEQWLNAQTNTILGKEDPLQELEWQRLVEDLNFYQNSPSSGIALKGTIALPFADIQQSLEEQMIRDKYEANILQVRLMELANRLPDSSIEKMQHGLQQWGGTKKEISLDDIFISFAQKEPRTLQSLNTSLDQRDLHEIYSLAARYLSLSVRMQQAERCLETCRKLADLPESISSTAKDELIKRLLGDLLAKREYALENNPEFLVFEYYAGILIRKEQINKLQQFFSDGLVNPVMEMIMGSGKSKVLLPLLGLLRANGKTLSLLVVPSALFESVSCDTQKILKEAFAKNLRTLHFDRNTTFSKRSLEEIRDVLKQVIKNKECLIMTSKSIQSLLLKFIEQADRSFQRGEFLTDKIRLMQEIIGLLKKCGNPLIDEADTVLNVLHEVSFSLGNKYNPKGSEIHLIGELYHLLYTDPNLKAIAKLESDPFPNLHAPAVTEESYYKTLQRPLAEAIIERLKTASLSEKRLEDQLRPFLTGLPASKRILLLDYLCRDKTKEKEAQMYYKTLPDDLKEVFALLGEEISHLLPHSLTRISDQNYGLDGDVLAIPYKASQIPNSGSQFSNPYVTMNYTYQIHYKNGISKKTIEEQVAKIQRRALVEIDESGGTMVVSDTEAWKIFCTLKGDLPMPLFNYSESQIGELTRRINSSSEIKRDVINEVFLPQMTLFSQKLACNPVGFASLFRKLSGFTGTLWNANSMHRKLTTLPEQGTDAKTLNLLWNMGVDNVEVIPKESVDSMLDALASKGIAFDMISDAGGYFKEGDNCTIARKLALKSGKPVVFYNLHGEQSLTDGRKERPFASSALSSDARLTFLDQSHTTGADVPQRLEAMAVVTIGRNLLLRDLLQSVWRLRGLEKGQKVKFVIDEEVESIIRHTLELKADEKIGFPEILRFVVKNQSKQQGNDNFKSFKNQVWDLPQSLLLEVILRKKISPENREKAYGLLKNMWIKPIQLSASEAYGSPAMERPSSVVIAEESKNCKTFLRDIGRELPFLKAKTNSYQVEIDQLANLAVKRVHPQIISPVADDSETVEIEQEVEIETQVSVEVQTQEDSAEERIKLGRIRMGIPKKMEDLTAFFEGQYRYELPLIPIEKQMASEPLLSEFGPYFKDIRISINVLEWREGEKDRTKVQLFGPHRIPYHHLHVEGDEVTLFAIECDRWDPTNYNLYLGFTQGQNQLTDAAFEKITKVKFLNGESTYNKKELGFLEIWIREAGWERMRRLFGIVLNNQPDKAAAFAGSPLHKVFNKLASERQAASHSISAIQ